MNDPILLDPTFQIIGFVSAAASSLAFACSIGHAWFYFMQRQVQRDDFMLGLACRMKVLFTVMSAMFMLDLVSGFGLMFNYTMQTWCFIATVKASISITYVAALFWLYLLYRRPHGL